MIKLNNKFKFSYKSEPLIISEISGNHNGSKKKFLDLIKSACENGTDLVKIQTYEPQDITLKEKYGNFRIKKGLWKGKTLWELYKKAHTPFSWHKEAFKIAKKYNKILFSSPFSIRGVDLLEKLGCKIYKIASFEITDHKLIDYIASKKKPIILSTGMATINEISKAIKIIKKYHSKVIILHCISSYPTKLENINLDKINVLKKKFPKNLIGLSDHTNDIYSSIVATQIGVCVIEKHFKLNNFTTTTDSAFSITPEKLLNLKKISSKIFKAKNMSNKTVENISKNLRRSIFVKKDIKKNEKLSKDNIETYRPKIGICASKYFEVIGKKVNKNLKQGEPIFNKNIY